MQELDKIQRKGNQIAFLVGIVIILAMIIILILMK
jgi:hypothetical protein